MSKLFQASLNDEVLTDFDAVLYLYQEDNRKSQQNFRRLKSRLKSRIYNTIFFLDQNKNSFSAHQQTIIEQNKVVQTIQILRRLGANKSAIELIKNNIHVAEKFQLYDIAKFYAFELAKFHAILGQLKLFNAYKDLYEDFLNKETLIQKSTLAYYQIQLIVHYSKGNQKRILNENDLNKLLSELNQYKELLVDNNDTSYFFLRSKLFVCEYLGQLEGMFETCQSIIQLSTQENFKQPVWQGIAALYKAKTYLSTGNYSQGISELSQEILLFQEGGVNWMAGNEYLLKLSLFQLDALSVEDKLNNIFKHKSFKSASEHYQQRMAIYKAYCELLQFEQVLQSNKRLKIGKLMNELTYYVNDKLGFYLSFRFLELIELLRAGDTIVFEERCLLLKKYSKQMVDTVLQREKDFSMMILSISKLKYNKKAIIEKNAQAYECLKDNKNRILVNDFEVLPYHFLWEIILRYL
ncbi:MAG: hypothetical protein M9958_12810 [Chitinophagales bacterium]|nr:hypothetical protein [Chitinophagales bacterium]